MQVRLCGRNCRTSEALGRQTLGYRCARQTARSVITPSLMILGRSVLRGIESNPRLAPPSRRLIPSSPIFTWRISSGGTDSESDLEICESVHDVVDFVAASTNDQQGSTADGGCYVSSSINSTYFQWISIAFNKIV